MKPPAPSINFVCKLCRFSVSSAVRCACALLLVCFAVAVGFAGQAASPVGPPDDVPLVAIEHSAQDKATIYRASLGDCSIQWIAYTAGPNQGVVKHSPRCDAPLELQITLLTKICTAFFSRDEDARAFRTLFWGGLEAERKQVSGELSFRLALAAYQSPDWDTGKGKPKKGDLNGFIKDLANRGPIYPELKELFRRFHRDITLSVVEKVRVFEAEKLPFYDRLRQKGVMPKDRLPFDCMAWFAVTPLSP